MTAIANKSSTSTIASSSRVSWVDIVKGMSIFLVVMMHSTPGVQNALGETSWMGAIVEFARPFRIPGFMLVSGLFLHRTIHGDWSRYLVRKTGFGVFLFERPATARLKLGEEGSPTKVQPAE